VIFPEEITIPASFVYFTFQLHNKVVNINISYSSINAFRLKALFFIPFHVILILNILKEPFMRAYGKRNKTHNQ
jgi:predicted glycosyltransferase involved in capsule biosynthesis